jgi:AsmA protein
MEFNEINGNITGDIDTLCINNLDLLIGNSDLNINGEIYDLSNMLDTNNNDFTTNLTINSNLLDLADLLSFKENVGRGFPYQITDLYINLTANTNREKFKSTPVPDINFDIHRLDCNANKLVPPVTIKDLKFRLGDLDGSLYLTFNDFKAIFSTGTLSGDVTYHEPYLQTPYLEVDALINNFDLMNFFYTKKGKLKKPPYSYLNGDAYCKLFFSTDTSTIFSKVDFSSSKLSYSTDSANLQITNLKINSDYVNYNSYYIKNPLATLTTDIDIKAKKLKYNNIDVNSFWYNIMANDGKYTLTPKKSWLYANDVSGTIAISPFNKPFDINIDMSIKKLNLEKSLNMVIKDSAIMKGDIDIDINISSSSDSISRIKNNINGNVDISGEKLALIGIDIDQILSDIDRSQHFNLIDLGGVLLAGPIGLLFTKGSDYTRILLSDHSQTTIINKFISNWEISNSVFKIDDFAFNSKENLVATKGELNLVSDSLDFTIAIVNDKGCSKVSQRIAGPTTAPQIGKMVIVKTLIAPVTNLMKIESNCKPFYTGSVKYPDIKE